MKWREKNRVNTQFVPWNFAVPYQISSLQYINILKW
jgi:hypothetical protein